jgi:TolB-like protein/DNA-binding winged helix-turn-helix (wHTH) protein/Flp pilus assembly protein TadD
MGGGSQFTNGSPFCLASTKPVRFGIFEVDLRTGELRKGGVRVKLHGQPFAVLAMLLERPGDVVTREELQQKLWASDTFVDFEHGLNKAINKLREALGDDANNPRYIETLPRRGYRFVGPIAQPATVKAAPTISMAPFWRRTWPLAGLAFVMSATVAASLLVGRLRERSHAKAPAAPIHSVAVLPLENLSHDPEQQYFADGMTDELITDLAKIHALRVISRNSIMVYKGHPKPLPQVARELNVDAVVEGTVMRSGDRVRITAQLVEAPKDRHLWAEAYEGDLRDILSLQDQVARAIAAAVKTTLTPQEQTSLSSARPVVPAAHHAYLRGLYELHGTTDEAKQRAIWNFQQALVYDPDDALAYAGLADAYSRLSTGQKAPLEVMPKAKAAALKAIELDDTLAEAHASLGYVKLFFDWDWSGGGAELRKALELNPNLAVAHAHYAKYLLLSYRADEGIQELQRAYDLDPLLPSTHGGMVWFLFEARRFSDSVQAAKTFAEDDPIVAFSYLKLGQRDAALAVADHARGRMDNPVILAYAATAYAAAGRKEEAHMLLNQILQQAQQRYICGYNVASVYAALGDKEQAFAWLEKAYLQRSD